MFLRSSRVNLQIIWSSTLFQQVPYTHMELDLGKLVVFSIPKVKSFGKKSFGYKGCVLWNEFPDDIRSLQGYPNFKIAVKKLLLGKIDW